VLVLLPVAPHIPGLAALNGVVLMIVRWAESR
jgi:hypothetical protein